MKKIFAILVLVLVLSAMPVHADLGYADIMKKVQTQNQGLDTFKVPLKIKLYLPGAAFDLGGTLYFKYPDKGRLIIPVLPKSMEGKQGLFKKALPSSFRAEDYYGKVLDDEKVENGIECYVLRLKPKDDPKIDHAKMWITKDSFLIVRMLVVYSGGTRIHTRQGFRKVDCFILPDAQEIEFRFPGWTARSIIKYGKYQVNKPLDVDV